MKSATALRVFLMRETIRLPVISLAGDAGGEGGGEADGPGDSHFTGQLYHAGDFTAVCIADLKDGRATQQVERDAGGPKDGILEPYLIYGRKLCQSGVCCGVGHN